MSSLPPRPDADDQALVEALRAKDKDAWERFLSRFGRALRTVVVRVVDERRGGTLGEVPQCIQVAGKFLQDGLFDRYRGAATLRCFMAAAVRSEITSYLQDVTPPASLIASLPTPTSLFLDEVLAEEPAKRAGSVVDKMPPNMGGLLRLRLRGLDRADIGSTLGLTDETVRGHLEHLAERLGELDEEEPGYAEVAWRMLLDAAPIDERVATADRTLRDARFARVRSVVESTFRALRERELLRLHPRANECLEDETMASFVDGTAKGPDRTRVEGHIATCPRCIDAVAILTMDMRTIDALRDVAEWNAELAVAAACVTTTRFRAAALLAELAKGDEARVRAITRLARIGLSLSGGSRAVAVEPSRIINTAIPSDADAPLVALEALVNDDTHSAFRAIDDALAHGPLGARLRLLALAAEDDVTEARKLAEEIMSRSQTDPGLVADAQATLAIPKGDSLPREILIERVRDTIPAAVRYLATTL
jgi:hypothetical protein